jgi:pimeloyl-ACP methyl ester carboxylesterase
LLSSIGALRLLGVSFGPRPESLPPPVQGYARATAFRGAAYRAAADEIIHMNDSANEVRAARRTLTRPVVVLTGARGADAAWQDLQRDQVGLSQRGCQIIAEQSGHVIPFDQPQVIVAAIRAMVDMARGRPDLPLCGSPGGG